MKTLFLDHAQHLFRGQPRRIVANPETVVLQVRLKGLDTRTFEYLAAQARAATGAIADKDALAAEEELSRCREPIPPVRRVCAQAAQALVSLIEEQAAGAATTASKQLYVQAMPRCERWMDLPPLSTALRTPD